jgi:hypothetical protein
MPVQPPNVDFPAGLAQQADVGTPQVGNLAQPSYQSEEVSDKVASGRAKSAFNSEQVPDCREASEARKERWSRGCRRAHVSFWFWLWFRLSPPAPRKKSKWSSRLPSSRNTPASTSNLAGRACRQSLGGPALIFGLLRRGAVCRLYSPKNSVATLWAPRLGSPNKTLFLQNKGQIRC